ncbi:MAG: RnfABCDGE type electron transport complex subunit B [Oscillospiraceae bacterium]|jgi:Na+-translocating ferredoxin:NAD+ oxidoreductase RNF subunit RnfB|nr:RnfABCDGE type electron transport complex subunit B [Oscillospiraceae bacterium]
MNPILFAILAVAAIGAICAVMLTVASKVMYVHTDEREADLRDCLPGANCGSCGYAGCDGYAAALVGGDAKTNLCVPGGDDVSRQISDILGVPFEDVIEQVAICHCGGSYDVSEKKLEYQGIMTCAAAKTLYGGESACAYGCLGYGDCAVVCPNNAVCIEDGVARINPRRCIGCGACARVCPNKIISTVPDTVRVIIKCSSCDKGADVRKKCEVGCIGCRKCEKECPESAITVTNNLAVIDYDKCSGCGHCAEVCTTKCIKAADFSGVFRN